MYKASVTPPLTSKQISKTFLLLLVLFLKWLEVKHPLQSNWDISYAEHHQCIEHYMQTQGKTREITHGTLKPFFIIMEWKFGLGSTNIYSTIHYFFLHIYFASDRPSGLINKYNRYCNLTCTIRDNISALVNTVAFGCSHGAFESLSDFSEEALRRLSLETNTKACWV